MNWTAEFQQYFQDFVDFVPKLVSALITFLVFLLLSGLVRRTVRKVLSSRISNQEILKLLSRLSTWTVLIFGTILALEQVNFNVTSFVAGLGIAGLTIGFALQDIAKNFVAGILLLIRQPFKIGDAVEISGFKGTVQDIAIRDTSIKTYDGELVILPNASILENPIKNFSGLKQRRRAVKIGLDYKEDVDRAKRVFLDAIRSVSGVAAEPAPSIIVMELGDSALMLTAFFWVDQVSNDLYTVHSAAVQAISEAANRENISLPYPIHTVHVQQE